MIEFHDKPDMDFADLAIWQQEVSGGVDPVTGITCAGILILTFLSGIEYGFAVTLPNAFSHAGQFNHFSAGSTVTVNGNEPDLKRNISALVI